MSDNCVLQPWVLGLSFMQQSVLLTAVRGPDGVSKFHGSKAIVRWYRRCVLKIAFDRQILTDPVHPGGGSFTGPSLEPSTSALVKAMWEDFMEPKVGDYLRAVDELPHHYQLHMMHAAQIVGYHHPDERISKWWRRFYTRLVHDMHLFPESKEDMDVRLGDTAEGWRARADPAVDGEAVA